MRYDRLGARFLALQFSFVFWAVLLAGAGTVIKRSARTNRSPRAETYSSSTAVSHAQPIQTTQIGEHPRSHDGAAKTRDPGKTTQIRRPDRAVTQAVLGGEGWLVIVGLLYAFYRLRGTLEKNENPDVENAL